VYTGNFELFDFRSLFEVSLLLCSVKSYDDWYMTQKQPSLKLHKTITYFK